MVKYFSLSALGFAAVVAASAGAAHSSPRLLEDGGVYSITTPGRHTYSGAMDVYLAGEGGTVTGPDSIWAIFSVANNLRGTASAQLTFTSLSREIFNGGYLVATWYNSVTNAILASYDIPKSVDDMPVTAVLRTVFDADNLSQRLELKWETLTVPLVPHTTGLDPAVIINVQPAAIPLPASAALLVAGLGGFAALRRKKKATA
ncbi:VPLPA-CTERM sorting domain-containing protein [Paracoccus sp. (in: a-proteobacteria)]|uniref:VPLPA-CTERM sorting domain-containing protein n=1 Tax=Paracoccus sp. TaxID=267 RepID=UPI0026DFF3A7|nr:VPLPA-CTERM sorting domain-containing protein [Paracoccus sp. (in: a-proteobacteria)]MDO5646621.1 VPLPA-CTERM sorting domain-containing protein [Paracoccus sp. (in: a-proteobacteria)]